MIHPISALRPIAVPGPTQAPREPRPASLRQPARDRQLGELVNIGPFTARRLQSIGLRTPSDLEALGAVEAYRRLAAAWPDDTTIFTLYALQGALLDLRWDALPEGLKDALGDAVA